MTAATVLLFLLFPRLPPLWQLPGAKLNQTGLSDNLAPSSVSSLLQSNALAFRVKFDGAAPPPEMRYFRAKIYDVFDGQNWRAQRPQLKASPAPADTPHYRYTVIAEPHQQFSLFVLGLPNQNSSNVAVNREALVVAEQPLSQRISYQLSSSLVPLPARGDVSRYLQLPAGNVKARELALRLNQGVPSAKTLAARIGSYFQQQQFRYSLSPGEINGEQIDNFLFDKKLGFCSHYASSTVFLLRAAGVPARLVGGYLGGEWQDNGAYLQVLQKDAHAWVEYYQDNRWWPFDPTALIEPSLLVDLSEDSIATEFSGLGGDWMLQRVEILLMQPLRNMDYYWSMWVLSFDSNQQQSLFGQLNNWRQQLQVQPKHAFWLLILPGLGLVIWWWRRPRIQPVEQLFQPLLRLQAKLPQQSYQQYLQQWAEQQPMLMPEISACLDAYLRWQFNGEPGGLIQARQIMKQLKPKLKRLKF
jgi:transglutaminase-like putative cysteine protease